MFIDFRERGREKESGERERNIDVREKHPSAASRMHPNRDQAHNLSGVRAGAPAAEPPGQAWFESLMVKSQTSNTRAVTTFRDK